MLYFPEIYSSHEDFIMKLLFIVTEKIPETETYSGCLAITDIQNIDPDNRQEKFFMDYEDNSGLWFMSYLGSAININTLIENNTYFSELLNSPVKEIKNILLNSILQIISEKEFELIPIYFIDKIKQYAFDMLIEKYGKIEFIKQSTTEKYIYSASDNVVNTFYFCIWLLSKHFDKNNNPENFFKWLKNI